MGRPRTPGAIALVPFGAPSDAAELYRRAGLIPLDAHLAST
jgi:hypothetical protein